MFQISADQTQWFHLFRVLKVFPTLYVLSACAEAEVEDMPAQVLDLRIISSDPNMIGGSWWVKREGKNGKQLTRADIAKFLDLRAKFEIANVMQRGIDEIEMVETSPEELALAVSLDEGLKNSLEIVVPTIFSKLVRSFIKDISVNQTGFDFEEIPDWSTRAEI